MLGTSGAVIYTDMFFNPQIKLSILNNLQESPFIDDIVYSKVLYKKATLVIDEIASDIENFISNCIGKVLSKFQLLIYSDPIDAVFKSIGYNKNIFKYYL